jgi:hypothetical protein
MSFSIATAPALSGTSGTVVEDSISDISLAPEVDLNLTVIEENNAYFIFLTVYNHLNESKKVIKLLDVKDLKLPKSEQKNKKNIISGGFSKETKLLLLSALFCKGLELFIELDVRGDEWKSVAFNGSVYGNRFNTEPFDISEFDDIFLEHV